MGHCGLLARLSNGSLCLIVLSIIFLPLHVYFHFPYFVFFDFFLAKLQDNV